MIFTAIPGAGNGVSTSYQALGTLV